MQNENTKFDKEKYDRILYDLGVLPRSPRDFDGFIEFYLGLSEIDSEKCDEVKAEDKTDEGASEIVRDVCKSCIHRQVCMYKESYDFLTDITSDYKDTPIKMNMSCEYYKKENI